MPDTPRVLVVEDDARLLEMLRELFSDEGYFVVQARDGQRALHEALTSTFDVMILDRSLPVIEGLDLIERLRSRGVRTPVLVLSALGNPSDRVEGLDRGAEDYLAKPFDIDELLARTRALLRRSSVTTDAVRIPGGLLDAAGRTVELDSGELVVLSEREGELLGRLARRPGQVFERAALLAWVFPGSDDLGVVDTYVHYLRRKLGRDAVVTVRGIGYRIGAGG